MIKQNIFGWVKPILSWLAIHNLVMILNSCFYVGENRGKTHYEKLVYYTGCDFR